MNIFKKLLKAGKSVLSVAGPTLGLALGGPLGGMAVSRLTKALGVDESALEGILAAPNENQLEQIQLAEKELAAEVESKKIDLEAYRIDADDRDSARDMRIKTGDDTPIYLGFGVVAGFFGVMAAMMIWGLPEGVAGQATLIMLGSLGTMTTQVMNFFFGSSKGSKEKTEAMASKLNGR